MKTFKLVLTVLAALWTVGVVVGVFDDWRKGSDEFIYGFAAIAVSVAITACLYEWAMKKPTKSDEPQPRDMQEPKD